MIVRDAQDEVKTLLTQVKGLDHIFSNILDEDGNLDQDHAEADLVLARRVLKSIDRRIGRIEALRVLQ